MSLIINDNRVCPECHAYLDNYSVCSNGHIVETPVNINQSTKGELMNFTHCIVAKTSEGEIVHWVGYESKPEQADFDSLKEEIATDEEFGYGVDKNDLTLSLADEVEFEQFLVMTEEFKDENS